MIHRHDVSLLDFWGMYIRLLAIISVFGSPSPESRDRARPSAKGKRLCGTATHARPHANHLPERKTQNCVEITFTQTLTRNEPEIIRNRSSPFLCQGPGQYLNILTFTHLNPDLPILNILPFSEGKPMA